MSDFKRTIFRGLVNKAGDSVKTISRNIIRVSNGADRFVFFERMATGNSVEIHRENVWLDKKLDYPITDSRERDYVISVAAGAMRFLGYDVV